MSEKKRKSNDDPINQRPQKIVATGPPANNIKVSLLEDGGEWQPVLAYTPGLSLPKKASFKAYKKAVQSRQPTLELLLHSQAHPKLDYTASEETSNGPEGHLKHYIGVYDPIQGKLQLYPAKKVTVRSTLRSARTLELSSEHEDNNDKPSTVLSARNTLGLTFGTKKSQKAIHALTTNAIQSTPSKPAREHQSNASPSKPNLDSLADAIVSSMAEPTASMPSREEMQASIDENKPRPKPNLAAETPADVYPIEQLVGGEEVLKQMQVKDWIDTIQSGADVPTSSLFVAKRLVRTVESGGVKVVRVLKYTLLLIEWFKSLRPHGKDGKKVPPLSQMGALTQNWGSDLLASLSRRFALGGSGGGGGGTLNRHAHDTLLTHLLALTLHIDNFSTDTHDIAQDLRLTPAGAGKYYQELGASVGMPTEAERGRMGISRGKGGRRVARLRVPVVLPRSGGGRGGRGRGRGR